MKKICVMMATLFVGVFDSEESDDVGAGILEYALLVAFIAVVASGAVTLFGTQLRDFLNGVFAALGI